jgi:hypothetical protein
MTHRNDLELARLGLFRVYRNDLQSYGIDDPQILYCLDQYIEELERQHDNRPITRQTLADLQSLHNYSTVVLAALELDLPEIIAGMRQWPDANLVAKHIQVLLGVIRQIVDETLTIIRAAEGSYPVEQRMHWAQERIDMKREISHYASNHARKPD